ncbi:MAG: aminotransferase class I/II-fold pyridoxal phosphate-dependent enzyme [Anaerolineales bacterium]
MKIEADRMHVFPEHFFAGLNVKIQDMQGQGQDVIRLDIGSPDLPPDAHIIAALKKSAENPHSHGYQPSRGSKELRHAWAGMYQRLYQVDMDPESEILPLLGSKEGIFNLVMANVNPGDVVLIPDPGYLTYNAATRFAGGEPVFLPLTQDHDYLPDLQTIPEQILKRAKLLWLNYPNNPTAGIANTDFFSKVVAMAREHELLVCHDAAYCQVTYDIYQAPSILQVPGAKDVAVEFNTLSKSHNMAGWRTGVAIGNADVIKSLHGLKTNFDSGQFLPIMEAAAAALNGDQDWLVERNQVYQQRRDIVIESLHQSGLSARVPRASLYVWCAVPNGWSAREFTAMLLDQAQISLTPGDIFGAHGEGYVRISLTAPIARTEEAMQRMSRVLQGSGEVME